MLRRQQKIVKYYARSVFTTPPPHIFYYAMDPSFRRKMSVIPRKNGVRTRCAARDSKSQGGSKFTTRSKFTMHSLFSTAGILWAFVQIHSGNNSKTVLLRICILL